MQIPDTGEQHVKLMCCCFLCADLEMAVAYWNLVLSGRFKFLDLWNRFLLVSQQSETIDTASKYVKLVPHQNWQMSPIYIKYSVNVNMRILYIYYL